MNGRVIGCLIVACVVFGLRSAAADVTPDEGLSPSIKTNIELSASDERTISNGINAEIAKVADDSNPDQQSAARDWLINESAVKDNPSNTSTAFSQIYSGALNAACVQQLNNPASTVRCRLNLAVAVARVLDHTDNDNLMPSVLLLLKDKSPSVVIWGQRAAGNMLEAVLKPTSAATDAERKALFDAIIAAVAAHPEPPLGGIIADEAYRSIGPNEHHLNRPQSPLSDAARSLLVHANIQLQETRMKQYLTGVPEWPDADTYATGWLTSGAVWESMSPDDRKAAMQQASNLISLAGHRAAQKAGGMDAVGLELTLALRHEGDYVRFLADRQIHSATLTSVARSVAALSPTTSAEAITSTCDKVFAAIRESDPMFADLQPPPVLGGTASSTITP